MTGGLTADNRVADVERALLHHQAGDHAAALMDRGIEADPGCQAVGVGPQVVELGDREQGVEQ